MATVAIIDLIDRALRKINVIPEGVTCSAEQGATGLAELNSMFPLWEEDGIRLQWFFQDSTANDFPCPEYTIQGVIGALAIALAPQYGREISQELLLYADMGMQTIVRKAMNAQLPRADMSHLPQGSGQRNYGYDITRGE